MNENTSNFTPSLKVINVDDRGRLSLGSVYPQAKGAKFRVAIDPDGRVLLTPVKEGEDG